ncbi:MAG: hypothetical protein E7547_09410 [Ruminococcaceae bacterium]|nr:hypothetical protein [Oscillospiraceae bacterium]
MKILRAYAVTAIICISLTSIIACVFIADESAKKISLGDESAVVVFSSTDENLYEKAVNPMPIFEKIKNAAEKAASIAPPPVSNIYWFAVNT